MWSRRRVAVGGVAVVATLACGRLADSSYSPEPLAVIQGTLSDIRSDGEISLAVFWYPAWDVEDLVNGVTKPLENPYRTDNRVTVEPFEDAVCDGTPARGREVYGWTDEFAPPVVRATRYDAHPLSLAFAVPIEELPPPIARVDLSRQGGRGTFALGYVVAFQDEDGDGTFRHGTPANPPEPVLARAVVRPHDFPPSVGPAGTSYFVAFLDGQIERSGLGAQELAGLRQGFNVYRIEIWSDAYGRSLGIRRRVMPMDAPVELAMLPGAERLVGCSEGTREFRRVDSIPKGSAPNSCSAELDQAWWFQTTGIQGSVRLDPQHACATVEEEYRGDFSCASTPPPGWDCPIRGELWIDVRTSPWIDPDGYRFAVYPASGGVVTLGAEPVATGSLGSNEELEFGQFPAGEYVVKLDGLSPRCSTMTAARPVTVVEAATSEVLFDVSCSADGAPASSATAGGAASSAADSR